ncbi:MAG: hypothetical protein Q9211_005235 [Gyalolechia sp. 1 TL-2023]
MLTSLAAPHPNLLAHKERTEHQVHDRERHAPACKAVTRSKGVVEREEQKLRNSCEDYMTPANPFDTYVGHFSVILSARDYMLARYGLVDALLKIKTFDAVRAAADHVREMLRLCRRDNMGIRDLLPASYLRLGLDQEAYDFVKWWETKGREYDYDWGDMSLPFLDTTNADVFESPRYLCDKYPSLTNMVCLALLKLKLLMDLKALRNSALLGGKLPRELFDRVKYFVPTSEIIRKNNEVMSSTDHTHQIRMLALQFGNLFSAITKANKHFWPALINPGENLSARPETYSMGGKQEM